MEFDTAENRLRNKYTSAAGGLAEPHSSASPLCQIGHAFLPIGQIHCQMAEARWPMWSAEICCRHGGNKDLSVSYLFFPFNPKYSGLLLLLFTCWEMSSCYCSFRSGSDRAAPLLGRKLWLSSIVANVWLQGMLSFCVLWTSRIEASILLSHFP